MGGLVIAGDRSGTGKTTVTLALLAALAKRVPPNDIQSFKVGPDYIDPMFHQAVTGRPCYTLDPVLTSEAYVQDSYKQHRTTYSVIEGVMGLFDGADPGSDTGSTAQVARLLNLPVVLVVDCGRLSRSLAALVLGYQRLDPRLPLAGVVLNRVGSDRHLDFLQQALASIAVPVLGAFRRETDIALPDRHLGLVPVGELAAFQPLQGRLADLGTQGFDWERLAQAFTQGGRDRPVPLADRSFPPAPSPTAPGSTVPDPTDRPVIAVARDPAFNFYYPENLALLEQAGATLQTWSPMTEPLPQGVQGLYLGGGFPEVFAAALAENQAALTGVRAAIANHLPTYAECGGLMYLCKTLVDFNGQAWPMADVLETTVAMDQRLSLGYRRAQVLSPGPLLPRGTQVIGHEFHRSRLRSSWGEALYRSQRAFGACDDRPEEAYPEGTVTPSLHASYLHLHWGARPEIPQRFVAHCRRWGEGI